MKNNDCVICKMRKELINELSYSSMVEKTVIEKVKPECLIRGVD
jgi:hypothetical protein